MAEPTPLPNDNEQHLEEPGMDADVAKALPPAPSSPDDVATVDGPTSPCPDGQSANDPACAATLPLSFDTMDCDPEPFPHPDPPGPSAVPPSLRYADMFRIYDTGNSNALDHPSMVAAFGQLGLLNGLNAKLLGEVLGLTGGADATARGRMFPPHEFIAFCDLLARWQAKAAREQRIRAASRAPGVPRGAERAELLRQVYARYAVGLGQGRLVTDGDFAEPRMSASQLQRVVQDCGLMAPAGPLSNVSVDVVFAKCKPTGARKLGHGAFLRALVALAEESGVDVWEAVNALGARLRVAAPPPPVRTSIADGLLLGGEGPGAYHSDPELLHSPTAGGGGGREGLERLLPRLPQPPGAGTGGEQPLPFKPRSKYYTSYDSAANGGGIRAYTNLNAAHQPSGAGIGAMRSNQQSQHYALMRPPAVAAVAARHRSATGAVGGVATVALAPMPRHAFAASVAADVGDPLLGDPLLAASVRGGHLGSVSCPARGSSRMLVGIASLPQGQAMLASRSSLASGHMPANTATAARESPTRVSVTGGPSASLNSSIPTISAVGGIQDASLNSSLPPPPIRAFGAPTPAAVPALLPVVASSAAATAGGGGLPPMSVLTAMDSAMHMLYERLKVVEGQMAEQRAATAAAAADGGAGKQRAAVTEGVVRAATQAATDAARAASVAASTAETAVADAAAARMVANEAAAACGRAAVAVEPLEARIAACEAGLAEGTAAAVQRDGEAAEQRAQLAEARADVTRVEGSMGAVAAAAVETAVAVLLKQQLQDMLLPSPPPGLGASSGFASGSGCAKEGGKGAGAASEGAGKAALVAGEEVAAEASGGLPGLAATAAPGPLAELLRSQIAAAVATEVARVHGEQLAMILAGAQDVPTAEAMAMGKARQEEATALGRRVAALEVALKEAAEGAAAARAAAEQAEERADKLQAEVAAAVATTAATAEVAVTATVAATPKAVEVMGDVAAAATAAALAIGADVAEAVSSAGGGARSEASAALVPVVTVTTAAVDARLSELAAAIAAHDARLQVLHAAVQEQQDLAEEQRHAGRGQRAEQPGQEHATEPAQAEVAARVTDIAPTSSPVQLASALGEPAAAASTASSPGVVALRLQVQSLEAQLRDVVFSVEEHAAKLTRLVDASQAALTEAAAGAAAVSVHEAAVAAAQEQARAAQLKAAALTNLSEHLQTADAQFRVLNGTVQDLSAKVAALQADRDSGGAGLPRLTSPQAPPSEATDSRGSGGGGGHGSAPATPLSASLAAADTSGGSGRDAIATAEEAVASAGVGTSMATAVASITPAALLSMRTDLGAMQMAVAQLLGSAAAARAEEGEPGKAAAAEAAARDAAALEGLAELREQLAVAQREVIECGCRAAEALAEARSANETATACAAAMAAAGVVSGVVGVAAATTGASAAEVAVELEALREACKAAEAVTVQARAAGEQAAAAAARAEGAAAAATAAGDGSKAATTAAQEATTAAKGAGEAAKVAADIAESAAAGDTQAAEAATAASGTAEAAGDARAVTTEAKAIVQESRDVVTATTAAAEVPASKAVTAAVSKPSSAAPEGPVAAPAAAAAPAAVVDATVATTVENEVVTDRSDDGAGAESSAVAVAALKKRVLGLMDQLAAVAGRADEAHALANGALQASLGTRRNTSQGGRSTRRSDAAHAAAAAAGGGAAGPDLEELDARVSAASQQSSSAFAQVRSLADKMAALEQQLTAMAGAAKTIATADAYAAAAPAGAAGVDSGSAAPIVHSTSASGGHNPAAAADVMGAAAKLVTEAEARLTRELGEALKELVEQAQDLEALRVQVQRIEAAAEGEAAGPAAAAAVGATAAITVAGDTVPAGEVHFVSKTEMQEVLDVIAGKLESQGTQLNNTQEVAEGLLADLQEAAHDVGRMTVQLRQLEERQDAVAAEATASVQAAGGAINAATDQIMALKSRCDALATDVEALKRPAAPGAKPGTAVAAAATSPGQPSAGVAPPQVEGQGAAEAAEAGAPWRAVLAADEAARARDVELDTGIQELSYRLTDAEKRLRTKQDVLQQVLLKIARQVDRLQNHVATSSTSTNGTAPDTANAHAASTASSSAAMLNSAHGGGSGKTLATGRGALQTTAATVLMASRPASPTSLARMLASRPASPATAQRDGGEE